MGVAGSVHGPEPFRQGLEPQVWVSAGSQNQSPAGGEGQLSSGGVKRYTRFVFVSGLSDGFQARGRLGSQEARFEPL